MGNNDTCRDGQLIQACSSYIQQLLNFVMSIHHVDDWQSISLRGWSDSGEGTR